MVSIGVRKLIAHGTSLGVFAFPNACDIEPEQGCLLDALQNSFCIRCASYYRPMTVESATGSVGRCLDNQPLGLPSLWSTRRIP